ncbi:MAG: hypothetical protein NC350_03375 [Corallococcus sp.]|nr:hypothetical protein [Corallococcus sp.]
MKNLLTLTQLNKQQIVQILEMSTQMRRIVSAAYKKGPQLLGHTVAGVWTNQTVISNAFTLAAQYLSGNAVNQYSALDTFETARQFDNMGVNTLVIGCENDNVIQNVASSCKCNVINGGSSQANPISALADLSVLMSKADGLQNLTVLTVGNRDISKMNELNYCLDLFNSTLTWYLPAEDFSTPRKGIVLDKLDAAFRGVDAVIDLGLQTYSEPIRYYGTTGGISESLLDKARIDVPLLGARRIVDKVGQKDYAYSALNAQQTAYVSVAMAVLYLMQKTL